MWDLFQTDLKEWLKDYSGEKFHALISDPPYNLDSIKKRFGKKDSAPAKFGTDGVFTRSSRGFMGKEWDTDIAFDSAVWSLIYEKVLLPGAIGMAFSSTRTYHRMASAIEEAGFIIHPMIGWINSQGFPKATHVKGSKVFEEYRYGLQALKPSFEPICVFQKPHEKNQLSGILKYGTGAFNIEGSRIGFDEIPSNVLEEWSGFGQLERPDYVQEKHIGRWPANIVITGDVNLWYDKFFYCVKPNRKEKDAGLEEKNPHPTVKPIELIKWLATLILPPVEYAPRRAFVPYAGSGSEMIATQLAGWDYVLGIEIEEESCKIAVQRLKWWLR
jgi:site-specific DNA-methyltransferase (adenine-specific)